MKQDNNILTADEGKVFIRKYDNFNFGSEIYLGYMHYLGDKKLEEPIMATPEMFEEIDDPDLNKNKASEEDK